jgi:hypothetical protein
MQKDVRTLIPLLLLFTATHSGKPASFQNLGFESGTFVLFPGGFPEQVSFDPAFPGWRGYVDGIQQTFAVSNTIYLSTSALTLYEGEGLGPVIDGNRSAVLHAALYGEPPDRGPADTAIAQTGFVPIEAQSLLFRAQIRGTGGRVTLGGEPLSLMPVLASSNYVLWAADISAWAGQEAELRFTALAGDIPFGGTLFILDSIEFSTTSVPEPSTCALFAVAGVLRWFYSRRQRR